MKQAFRKVLLGASLTVLVWPMVSAGQGTVPRSNVPLGSKFDKSANLPARDPAATVELNAKAAQDPDVTTVSPLVVRPELNVLGTIPDLSPAQLGEIAAQANDTANAALGWACHMDISEEDPRLYTGLSDQTHPYPVDLRDAFLATQIRALGQLEVAAKKAEEATAYARSAAGGPGAATAEAARLDAMRQFLSARMIADEATQRLADVQDWTDPPPPPPMVPIKRGAKLYTLAGLYHLPMGDPPLASEILAIINESTRQRLQADGIRGIYVPAEYADLGLSHLESRPVKVRGADAVRFTGRIHNTRDVAIPVPPLWFVLQDAGGEPIKSQQATGLTRKPMKPHSYITFTFDLKPVPDGFEKAAVTFAPQQRSTKESWIEFKATRAGAAADSCPPQSLAYRALREGTTPPPQAAWITGQPSDPSNRPWALGVGNVSFRRGDPRGPSPAR